MAWSSEVPKTETPKPRAASRPRNPRKAVTSRAAEGLMTAINFVRGATDPDKAEYAKFVRLANRWLIAYDGQVAAGHPIEEELTLCPHLARLSDAIVKAGATLAMSASDGGRLTVAGERLKAVVPCFPIDSVPPVFPDAPIAVIDDRLKAGFEAVTRLAKEDAETVHEGSVLLRANTVVGCNGALALEYWHGIDLPPGLAIPQKAAKLLAKSPLKLERFGFTFGRSATFYFEGGAWIRTQLYGEQWPDIDAVLNVAADPVEVPGLFEALDAVTSFSEDGAVHFHESKLKSTYAASNENSPVYGASYDLPGLVAGTHVAAKLLKLAQPAAKKIDYTTHEDKIVFYNIEAGLRGVLMKRR